MGRLLLEQLELLVEEETRRRLGQLSLDYIFTTGLPREDVDRYYPLLKSSLKTSKFLSGDPQWFLESFLGQCFFCCKSKLPDEVGK